MKKLIIILVVLVAIGAIYHLLAKTISDHISESYGTELNEKRLDIGLHPIIESNSIDSITCNEEVDSNGLSLFLDNEKSFIKEWSFNISDKEYYKNKLIGYSKSYWFWENRIIYEIDTYEKPISKLEKERLHVMYDYETKEYFAELDTTKTNLAQNLKTQRIDSIYQYAEDENLILCGTAMWEMEMGDDFKEIDTIGITRLEVDLILKRWNLK